MKIITPETAKVITNVNLDKFKTGRTMKSVYKTIEKAARQGSNNCSIYIQKGDTERVISILNSLGYRCRIYYSVYTDNTKKIYIEW